MNITTNDALSILGITEEIVNPEIVKQAYRRAARKYHPDHNPAGLEMMKLVNLAYELLKDFTGRGDGDSTPNYGGAINNALNAVMNLGLTIEVCGMWVWVSGDTRPHKEMLKTAGYMWAPKKQCWYFRPSEHKSYRRGNTLSMDEIRGKYGSDIVSRSQKSGLLKAIS